MKNSFLGLELSLLGVGTYLGEPDSQTSAGYIEVIKKAQEFGINVIDTAIVYRYMQSERDIAQVLKQKPRDGFFISTKGGYVPYDAMSGMHPQEYIHKNFIKSGLVDASLNPYHSLNARFIDWCFNKSLENLGVKSIDVYFLHNPEEALSSLSRAEFLSQIRACFEYLEGKIKEGSLRFYGIATWRGLIAKESDSSHVDIFEVFKAAREVGGQDHGFRFVQLPYNVGMLDATTANSQRGKSILKACQELGLYVYTSASIFQGRVIGRLNNEFKKLMGTDSDAVASLRFVISTPGVGTALVGMSKLKHFEENVRVLEMGKLKPEEFRALMDV
ncbi:MAG: aldo/keto reductase [Aquificaceae bacterium]